MSEASLEGFTSLLDAYRAVPEAAFEQMAERASVEGYEHFFFLELEDPSTREMEIERHVSNPLFLRLLNERSMMQIGNRVYRQFRDYQVVMESPTEDQIEQLSQLKWKEALPEGSEMRTIYRTERNPQSTRISFECVDNYANSPKRRMKGILYDEAVVSFCSGPVCSYNIYYYVEVKNQRRQFQVWWGRNADRIRTQGTRSANAPNITASWGGSSFYYDVLATPNWSWQLGVYYDQAGTTAGGTSFNADNLVQDSKSSAEGECNVSGWF